MIDLLRKHFEEVHFDEAFRHAAEMVDPGTVDLTNSSAIQSTFQAFHKVDNTFTLNEVREAFTRVTQPERIAEQIEVLKTKGITHVLADLQQTLVQATPSLPAGYSQGTGQAHLLKTNLCAYLPAPAAILGGAATIFGYGCLGPEPAWPVICPAAGVIGVIVGAFGFAVWVIC